MNIGFGARIMSFMPRWFGCSRNVEPQVPTEIGAVQTPSGIGNLNNADVEYILGESTTSQPPFRTPWWVKLGSVVALPATLFMTGCDRLLMSQEQRDNVDKYCQPSLPVEIERKYHAEAKKCKGTLSMYVHYRECIGASGYFWEIHNTRCFPDSPFKYGILHQQEQLPMYGGEYKPSY